MRRHRLVVVTVLILAAVLGAALPALAAGNPTYYTAGRQTLIYTASSGGQDSRRTTDDCPLPAQRPVDGKVGYACPQPTQLPPLPRPVAPVRSRIDPPDRGVCVTRLGLPCPRLPRAAQ